MPAAAHALVEVEDGGPMGKVTYNCPQETVEMLAKIDGPIAVVAIAGIYRSGKSFLLNCLAQPDREDAVPLFEVGPTINACTRGLWVWPTAMTVPQPDGTSLRVLFVDSEGLGAVGGTQQHDLQVFSLALLISSLFAFNSVGAIDESSISQLSFVTQLSKHIQVKSAGDQSELDKHFPDFVWILRDFTLNLVDEHHNPITEHEYLENALMEEPGLSEEAFQKNRVRELVKAFFKRRDCCALMRPAEEEEDLNALQTAAGPKVRAGFIQQVDALRTKMLGMLNPKTLNGKIMTGPMLGTMISALVTSLNAGDTMTITDAWDAVIQMQGQRAYETALESFRAALALDPTKVVPTPWNLPTSAENLKSAYETAAADAVRGLESDMLDKDQVIVDKLREEMTAEFKRLSDANDEKTAQVCSAMLSELWAPIHSQVVKGKVEGLEALLQEWSEVCTTFKRSAPSGVDGTRVLNEFLGTDVLADAVLAAQTVVDKYQEKEKAAAQGRSEAEAKYVAAVRDHMKELEYAAEEARRREEQLRERAEKAEDSAQKSTQDAIMERGETQREIAEMKRNLKIAGAKSEDAMAAAASQRAELEAANAALLSARHRESSLQQQTEMRALELAQEREMASAAAATGELRTSQLIQELDNLKRTKASNSEDADAAHNTIKELRMRLVSREEECGELQRQIDELAAGNPTGDLSGNDHTANLRVVQLEAGVKQEKAKCAALEKDRDNLEETVKQLESDLAGRKKKKQGGGGFFSCGAGPKKR